VLVPIGRLLVRHMKKTGDSTTSESPVVSFGYFG
jgi:hypothetical protein